MSQHSPELKKYLPTIVTQFQENSLGAVCEVIKEFHARLQDELTLNLGDFIEVISDDKEFNDGWYMGKSLTTGAVGLYPKSFTEEVRNMSRPSLLRSRSRTGKLNYQSPKNQSPISSNSAAGTPTSMKQSKLEDQFSRISVSNSNFDYHHNNRNNPNQNQNQNQNQGQNQNYNQIRNQYERQSAFDLDDDTLHHSNDNTDNHFTGALSDIDRALAELKNDVQDKSTEASQYSSEAVSLDMNLVESWTPEEVTAHFKSLGVDPRSCQQFINHKVTGAILLELELAFLKELDIDSFGTRFQIFKEIEILKNVANQQKDQYTFDEEDDMSSSDNMDSHRHDSYASHASHVSHASHQSSVSNSSGYRSKALLAAPEVHRQRSISAIKENNHDFNFAENNSSMGMGMGMGMGKMNMNMNTDMNMNSNMNMGNTTPGGRPFGHSRKKSKSLDDIPEVARHQQQLRKKNSVISTTGFPEIPREEQFASPRRAPDPPPFASPIQITIAKDSPSNASTPVIRRNSALFHSRNPSYEINAGYSFKSQMSPNSSVNYNSSIINTNFQDRNFKSASSADLLNAFSEVPRPTSSIYMNSNNHSRHSSVNLKTTNLPSPTMPSGPATAHPGTIPLTIITNNSSTTANNSNRHSRHISDLSGKDERSHRRHSSVFSFLSGGNNEKLNTSASPGRSLSRPLSNLGLRKKSSSKPSSKANSPMSGVYFEESPGDIRTLDPKATFTLRDPSMRSSSSQDDNDKKSGGVMFEESENPMLPPASPSAKRSASEATRHKTLRNISNNSVLKKSKTSAFMEGIRNITPAESIKQASCFGWMNKRGGIAVGTWKQRYFTLHGTRLSYFTSLNDSRERGLIDITSHKVLPARDDDKLVSLYAATTGHGKFCFKLVPPAPGSRKGLTFTQPKVHYFAVETKEEMRTWMAALIKATIDIDESVPVLSSCATPTVSLSKAQNLLAQARENVRKREELNRSKDVSTSSNQTLPPGSSNTTSSNFNELMNKPDMSGNSSISPDTDSYDSAIPVQSPNTTINTELMTPNLNNDTPNGFDSPYQLANMFTPKSNHSSIHPIPIQTSPVDEFRAKPYTTGALRHPSAKKHNIVASAMTGSYGNNTINANRI